MKSTVQDITALQATDELRAVASRYMRVREGGGDLRGEYPLLKAALVAWAAFYPKQAFRVGDRWQLSLDSVGEPFLVRLDPVRLDPVGEHLSKTKGTCVPNMARRKNRAATKGGAA